MIRNPYPIPNDEDKASCRFQTYLSGADKGLLFGLRPIRGTPQAVINHLIKNLCDELRELKITNYHPDADTILGILVERRPITADQLARIRRTLTSLDREVPTGVQKHRGGTSVRQRLTDTKAGADDTKGKTERGKSTDSEEKSKKSGKTKANRG